MRESVRVQELEQQVTKYKEKNTKLKQACVKKDQYFE